jgi:hypothetical protein
MKVEIGTVAAQFLFWEYLFQIFGIGSCSVVVKDLAKAYPMVHFLAILIWWTVLKKFAKC